MWDKDKAWQPLCEVDVLPLIKWLEIGRSWLDNPSGVYRVWGTPRELSRPIALKVFEQFDGKVRDSDLSLNRIEPGFVHGVHHDGQGAFWLTRVHVPLITNPGCWHRFEQDGEKVHFAAGVAYSFNTELRHDFGNDGKEARVHLVFDVYRVNQ